VYGVFLCNQVHQKAKEQLQELQQQVQQLQQERDSLQQQLISGQGQTQQHLLSSSWQANSSAAGGPGRQHGAVLAGASTPAFAMQFSRALQTADADRSVAVRRAMEAEQAVADLRQQMRQQEQELDHLRRCGQNVCGWSNFGAYVWGPTL
jgi:cell division septum initiation protein DivIVA